MRVLVIGGTRFVGRSIVSCFQAGGHAVTIFHRGQTRTDPVAGVEEIKGDRERDLELLAGGVWDVVIDSCGYVPRIVGLSVEALLGSVGRYVFISTISVYPPDSAPGVTEDSALVQVPEPSVEVVNGDTYGGLKVLCERLVLEAYGDRATIIRPGLVVGPGDYTDRFTYWALRFATSGAFPVPNKKGAPLQHIDASDLAKFAVLLAETGAPGAFHACGPYPPLTFGEFVERGTSVFGGVATPVWVDPAVFTASGVEPWTELPLVSSFDESIDGLFSLDNSKAVGAGLRQKALEESLVETNQWAEREKAGQPLKVGLSGEKERAILELAESAASSP